MWMNHGLSAVSLHGGLNLKRKYTHGVNIVEGSKIKRALTCLLAFVIQNANQEGSL